MTVRFALVLATLAALPAGRASAQEAPERGLYLTVFRSPSTGLEYRAGRLGVHAGWYPTILKTDGQSEGENTNFVRLGATAYLRPRGLTPFISPATPGKPGRRLEEQPPHRGRRTDSRGRAHQCPRRRRCADGLQR